MEDSSRTYTPSNDEYGLTTSSKDYENSHPKKNSMILNLGNKNNPFGADETPTPTRFIRNCEEVGLFQDLNVNPFEETFRKAIESGKTGTIALQSSRVSIISDDTLHTPHVFPHIIENESQPQQSGEQKTEKVGVVRAPVKVVRQEADTSQLRPIAPAIRPKTEKTPPPNPVQLILQMPDGRLMQLNATPLQMDKKTDLQGPIDLVARVDKHKPDSAEVVLRPSPVNKPDSDNISPLIKERLKARLGNPSAFSLAQRSPDQWMLQTGRGGATQPWSPRLPVPSNPSHFEDSEETKRRKFLERNRAAAMRCREKRKVLVASLKQTADQMMYSNRQLQAEVGVLKAEVARLKTLLLAHDDCSVTRAMVSTNQMVPNSMVSGIRLIPMEIGAADTVATPTVDTVKPVSPEESALRADLKKKLQNNSYKRVLPLTHMKKKKRLSLNIENAVQSEASQCFGGEEQSPIIRSDAYLSSTLVSTEPPELEISKSVATQVIKVNPNALFRDSSPLDYS